MKSLDNLSALRQFDDLQQSLDELVSAIERHCCGVVVYQLPMVEEDSTVSTAIDVNRVGQADDVDPQALELACSAFRQLRMAPNQKHNTTYRLPGCVLVTVDLSEQIHRINTLKSELKSALMRAYPKIDDRSRACRQLFPRTHMNHVYRHVYTVPEHTSRVNYTWQCQTPADVWITPQTAIDMAETALQLGQQSGASTERLTALQLSLEFFHSLPAPVELSRKELSGKTPPDIPYQLLLRNYVRPHPRAQLFAPPKGSKAFATHPCNLPMIHTRQDTPVSLRHLKNYRANQSRRRSDVKSGFTEISSALHIWGGVPTIDMYLLKLHLNEKARQRQGKERQSAV